MNNTVYKNASIVTGISVAERFLGFLYRIVLSRYIGAEGLGLYQVALSLFFLLQTLACGGIPVSVSRMVAKESGLRGKPAGGYVSGGKGSSQAPKNAQALQNAGGGILSAGLTGALLCSLPLCLLLWAFGGKMPFLFSGGEGYSVLRILLIGLSFACCYAVIRGYLWGNKRFLAASMLEMAEEIFMVLLGLFLLRGVPSSAVGAERAAWAMCLADILSCAVAFLVLFSTGGRLSRPKKQLKPLFAASLPITSVRAGGSLVNSAIAVLLPVMLVRAGATQAEALSLFGIVSGMVLPVLFIPATLIGSLALVLVPELSADYHGKNYPRLQGNIARGLRFSFLVACALVPFFFALGEQAGMLAFANQKAGEIISKGCLILLPMSLTMISTSMLNSIGFERQTFLFFFVGAGGMFLCVLLLPAVCGIYAYVVGLGVSYALTAACNLLYLNKKLPRARGEGSSLFPSLIPLIGILPLTLLGQLLLAIFSRFLGSILAVVATALLLGVATLLFYLLTRQIALPTKKGGKKPVFPSVL